MKVMQTSDVVSNFTEIINNIDAVPVSVFHNGVERAVIIDKYEYDQMMDAICMMQIVAIGKKEIAEGKVRPFSEVTKELREMIHSKDEVCAIK
jgi:PHD/YefM family antitoxin component YafN of YafNO toxin-antitoxin module